MSKRANKTVSKLIDRLRSHADLYEGKTQLPLKTELRRPYLAQELREAADTIMELRDDLQHANAENAKLRDLALNCYRMAKAHCTDKDCRTRCSHWPECCEHDSLRHAEPCELAVLACELGIEVEG